MVFSFEHTLYDIYKSAEKSGQKMYDKMRKRLKSASKMYDKTKMYDKIEAILKNV